MNITSLKPEITHNGIEGYVFQVITGIAITFMGLAFLMRQVGWIDFPINWWALFILLPAASFLFAAYHIYRQNGNRLTVGMILPGVLALAMGGLAISLLFGYYPSIN